MYTMYVHIHTCNCYKHTTENSQNDQLTVDQLADVYKSLEVQEHLHKSRRLSRVNLDLLDSSHKLMAFLSNVTNLLYAHTIMAFAAANAADYGPWEGATSPPRSHGGPTRSSSSSSSPTAPLLARLSMLGKAAGITMATVQSSRLVQAALFTRVGYHIGKLGLVRLVLSIIILC